MNWKLKLSDWLSNGLLGKYENQIKLSQTKLNQREVTIDSLRSELKQSLKNSERLHAQLSMSEGFQIELGEAKVELQTIKSQVEKAQYDLEITQNNLEVSESKLQSTLGELADSRNWLKQINIPVEVIELKKLIPKEEFEALWGFGLGTPKSGAALHGGSIMIKGWVLGRKSPVDKVQITYEDKIVSEFRTGLARPAIMHQYPDIPSAGISGFESLFSIVGMEPKTELTLNVILEDKSVIPLCAICLQKAN